MFCSSGLAPGLKAGERWIKGDSRQQKYKTWRKQERGGKKEKERRSSQKLSQKKKPNLEKTEKRERVAETEKVKPNIKHMTGNELEKIQKNTRKILFMK